ncbi:hypothetical protein DI272_06975 [Streptomyces sp. Act143]|uniref:hypothetical protein n=1 Tax=Streptomyces sp. Act143 TaxID=2200760 RepID=UPI000D68433C|nr:hypothetical protein [Streptomyces sp. Act143]PWI13922.1 hypothetical protein DI272_06975 [Streptomyces sp. Act143]
MASPHSIDPRALNDPRNHYPTDEEFYASDRPARPVLPEDRPRGGAHDPYKHPWTWGTIALVAFVVLIVLMGIALFP